MPALQMKYAFDTSITNDVCTYITYVLDAQASNDICSILLVSSRLDCPGISLADVCATCLEMSMWSFGGGVTLKCCS